MDGSQFYGYHVSLLSLACTIAEATTLNASAIQLVSAVIVLSQRAGIVS